MIMRTSGSRILICTMAGFVFSDMTLGDDETQLPREVADKTRLTENKESYVRFAGKTAGQQQDDNSIKMKFVWCLPGAFKMASSPPLDTDAKIERFVAPEEGGYDSDDDILEDVASGQIEVAETNIAASVKVFFLRGYWLGKYEVSQAEWKQVMATEPWKGHEFVQEGDLVPVTWVSWDDAAAFCRELTSRETECGRLPEGWEYTLPTEAQWERACRARADTQYSFGDDPSKLGEYAWYDDGTLQAGKLYAQYVGQKKANLWGLHDMHGNVNEWCRDVYSAELLGGIAPERKSGGRYRVCRGGSWSSVASTCGSASRHWNHPSTRHGRLGFRVALSLVKN